MEQVKDLLDSDASDFHFDVGLGLPISSMRFADRDEFVQSLAGYFTVVKVKPQIPDHPDTDSDV